MRADMARSDSLIAKLEELDRLYSELGEKMNDPAVACDGQKIVALAKENGIRQLAVDEEMLRTVVEACWDGLKR